MRVAVTRYRSRGVDTPADLAVLERDWERLAAAADGAPPGIGDPEP
jgi:hypothetical protein